MHIYAWTYANTLKQKHGKIYKHVHINTNRNRTTNTNNYLHRHTDMCTQKHKRTWTQGLVHKNKCKYTQLFLKTKRHTGIPEHTHNYKFIYEYIHILRVTNMYKNTHRSKIHTGKQPKKDTDT